MSAFTTYIFQEDYERLIRQELPHCTSDKGGRLFGQWTSTGNPVVHQAMSYSYPSSRDDMARNLYDKFRVCYIGEWRPVLTQAGNADYEMFKRKDLCRGGDAPERFLVLDVSKTDVVPFLFERQIPKGMGSLEKLPGKNPFNQSVNVLQPPRQPAIARNYNNPSQYPDPPAAAAGNWGQARPAPQFQEAATTGFQWYSAGDDGSEQLKKVLEKFKEIAQRSQVDLSRDKITQDISMSFIDNRYRKNWEVKFPSRFPQVGALLIKNPGKPHKEEQRQGSSDKAAKAAKNMIAIIQKPSF